MVFPVVSPFVVEDGEAKAAEGEEFEGSGVFLLFGVDELMAEDDAGSWELGIEDCGTQSCVVVVRKWESEFPEPGFFGLSSWRMA